jgi:steroid 5-alpha reductase family enzyme
MLPIIVLVLAVGLSAAMALAWSIALRTGQSGWIDAIWSLSIGVGGTLAALVPAAAADSVTPRRLIVAAMVASWSLRLGLHIALRTGRGGDDPRYAELRREWGTGFPLRLFWFLQIQALVALALTVAVLVAAHRPGRELSVMDWLGMALFATAFGGEWLADQQLRRFAADPANKGRVCDVGLWRRTRHPNYFFEWLGWLAIAAVALDFGGTYRWGAVALGAPALMYWLLVRVSGVPPLEAHMLRSRGAAYRDYQARVNMFWPGPALRRP